ncbi:hypothetical protein TVAG_299990 [Trichomonas vaginalis G3]|uniref:BAR domain-containing protein n=1 Tax=Trichomonas vaginalis (strain ATCC PRA-98 / G3) TaxID=412133 RepID=A2FAF2_TRIV3|nr:arfaptin homology (AH) domain/bar domain domain-containing protein [Trichomonas vaginalis G3]EAX98124.1 hypothetical protein TVAG_299990 [Trichomonas vaginalis G3]KAI5531607.1 arfaptin homology (AH) domain/bar domain domain-containing protein [Trichomonas vaginalis G3]|eukprot:XP_001311054.1 hypothetical protein [Trichomonas vaginalis G3]
MQSFWSKTKETLTIGVGTVADMTGAKKLPADTDYTERYITLTKIEEHLKSLMKSLESFATSLENFGDVQAEISNQYVKTFENDKGEFHDYSLQLDNAAKSCKDTIHSSKKLFLATAVSPLEDALKEIDRLKHESDQRKEALILLNSQEQKYNKSVGKGKVGQDDESKLLQRRAEYHKHHHEFITGVDALDKKKDEIFGKALSEYKKQLNLVVSQMQKSFVQELKDVPNFPAVDSK